MCLINNPYNTQILQLEVFTKKENLNPNSKVFPNSDYYLWKYLPNSKSKPSTHPVWPAVSPVPGRGVDMARVEPTLVPRVVGRGDSVLTKLNKDLLD